MRKLRHSTQTLASVGVLSIGLNLLALITRDNDGETHIVFRGGACAEIIGLLSLTPEEALSLGGDGDAPLVRTSSVLLVG